MCIHCSKGHVWQKQEVEREPVLGNISRYVLEDVGFEAQWVNKDGRQAGSQVSTGKRWAGQRERPSLAAVRSTSSGGFPLVLCDHSKSLLEVDGNISLNIETIREIVLGH